ncbi:MAG: DUF4386 family protein [Actinobacteria bacterium]|nr:DUF4386 family protein [Actinomycetota bacterium]
MTTTTRTRSTPTPTDRAPAPAPTRLRRAAGVAALVEAGTFVVGIAMFATVLGDQTTGDPTIAESVAFVVDHRAALHLWYIVTLIVFGIALVPLALGLRERVAARAPDLSNATAAFGLLWAGLVLAAGMIANVGVGAVADLATTDPGRAGSLWIALDTVQDGLGGGNEVVGGVWVLLLGVTALRTGVLPRGLALLGVVSAVAGVATVVPGLGDLGMVFGLGLIVWFTWLGVVLLRDER